jgi:hypothetical protein
MLGGRLSAAEEPLPANYIRPGPAMPPGAGQLRSLMEQLAKAPRRRDFKTVPMILDTPDSWDAEALDAIVAHGGSMKQQIERDKLGFPFRRNPRCAIVSAS